MGSDENVTDSVIRAENVATSLKNAKQMFSELWTLLIAMLLKGLPDSY